MVGQVVPVDFLVPGPPIPGFESGPEVGVESVDIVNLVVVVLVRLKRKHDLEKLHGLADVFDVLATAFQ